MLRSLHLKNVGPAPELKFEFAPRLNVLTGDNGLGKTLALDAVWYSLTWSWAAERALPNDQAKIDKGPRPGDNYLDAEINCQLQDEPHGSRSYRCSFHVGAQDWMMRDGSGGGRGADRMEESLFPGDGIVLYARVDGGFAVWDSYRNRGRTPAVPGPAEDRPRAYLFDRTTVWNGLEVDGQTLCNGLIRDWVSWQQTNNGTWQHLSAVLTALSGDGAEGLKAGKPKRVKIEDVRDIPTLDLAYGNVPVTHASAGMRRICALAYMVVWAWQEHRLAAHLRHAEPVRELVVLIDEIEAHLHPAWQRRVLPALLGVLEALQPEIRVQVVVATHAPLVLASLEPHFDSAKDALFMFDLTKRGVPRSSKVERAEWRRMGDASNWLTSEVFDLKSARSREAEEALEAAYKALDNSDTTLEQAHRIHRKLQAALKDTDPFWARWQVLAERLGIEA